MLFIIEMLLDIDYKKEYNMEDYLKFILEIHRPDVNELTPKLFGERLNQFLKIFRNRDLYIRVYMGLNNKNRIWEMENVILENIESILVEDKYFLSCKVPSQYRDFMYEGRGKLIPNFDEDFNIIDFNYIWKGRE